MTTHEKAAKTINGTQPYVLNLTDGMTDLIIKNAQQMIAITEASKAHLLPDWEKEKNILDEQRQMMEQQKAIFDALDVQVRNFNDKIAEQKKIISAMTHFNDHATIAGGSIQTNKAPVVQERTKAAKKISWLSEAYELLRKKDTFVDLIPFVDELTKAVAQRFPDNAKRLWHNRLAIANNFTEHARLANRSESTWGANFNPVLIMYKQKLGLYEWFDKKNNVPANPKHMKEFMFEAPDLLLEKILHDETAA